MLVDGYEIVNNFVDKETVDSVINEVTFSQKDKGIRNAEKKYLSIAKLITSEYFLAKVRKYFTRKPKLVRAILFNKTHETNWYVSWHQDKTVAVNKTFNEKDWGPWSRKEHIHHVQPPLDVLNQMLAFRIHLDDTTIENGCLDIIPKSHELGIIPQGDIVDIVSTMKKVSCVVDRGSALIMRPHLLHSSKKATFPSQRRVLHLEFSDYCLPDGISWA